MSLPFQGRLLTMFFQGYNHVQTLHGAVTRSAWEDCRKDRSGFHSISSLMIMGWFTGTALRFDSFPSHNTP